MKVAVVTCYKHNDYVRARTLRTAVQACPGTQAIIVRNRHRSMLRYPETMLRLLKTRFVDRPDAYVITFRGYEMLLFMRLALVRKPIIFDELINFTEWMEEHRRIKHGSVGYRLFRRWNHWVVKRCRLIIADTDAHADYSAILNKLSIERYRVIPTCADETVFRPGQPREDDGQPFIVLYYGSMLPLHGLTYILQAAEFLKDRPHIQFHLIGGKLKVEELCQRAIRNGAHIRYDKWVPFEELPKTVHEARLVLGGPFGDTLQSRFVITGKAYQAFAAAAPVMIGENQVTQAFTDKENCLIVPQADAQALARAIEWAYEHPRELAKIGQAGHRLYAQKYSQKVVNGLVRNMIGEL